MEITFNDLPTAVTQLYFKLENIERLLLNQSMQPQLAKDELMTVEEAAKLLSLAVPTVYALVSNRQIPFMKKRKRLYFSEKELGIWIKEGRKKTITEMDREADGYLLIKNKNQ